jgi:peptide/nickel transport system permease protein
MATATISRGEIFRRMARSKSGMLGIAIVAFWVLSAMVGRYVVPYDPFNGDMLDALLPPSSTHWFGTDQLGRDIFSRIIVGSRDILTVAPLATVLGVAIGSALGLAAGYFRGLTDIIISRLVEAFLALPLLILALLALVAFGASNATVVLAIGLSFTPPVARTVRSSVLLESRLDYVAAAKLRSEGHVHIMFVEILPNVLAPIGVEMTVRLGYAIFTVATLSFLGVGLQPPSPDWGLAISENYALVSGGFWWPVVFNSAAVASLIVAVNLITESAHEAVS